MKLHLDQPAFETLLLSESESSGIRADILEKDYYVTLFLNELADKQDQAFAYFKGGLHYTKQLAVLDVSLKIFI